MASVASWAFRAARLAFALSAAACVGRAETSHGAPAGGVAQGHAGTSAVSVATQPPRVPEHQPRPEPLDDLLAWLAATEDERETAAQWVADRMPQFVRAGWSAAAAPECVAKMPRFIHQVSGLGFVLLPGRLEFVVGSRNDEQGRRNDEWRRGALIRAFMISEHEVTQRAWRRLLPLPDWMSAFPDPAREGAWGDPPPSRVQRLDDDLPVVCRTSADAQRWCRLAGLRLPTEEEWEFACRVETHWNPPRRDRWSWGNDPARAHEFANLYDRDASLDADLLEFVLQLGIDDNEPAAASDGFAFLAPVGSKRPNGFGLFDMHGNVSELTATPAQYQLTRWENGYPDTGTSAKGGSFITSVRWARIAATSPWGAVDGGFRPAATIPD